jgi:hypothetical protein
MMMCDVDQERQAQKKLKTRKEGLEKHIDSQWLEQDKRKMEEFDDKMRKKIEEEYTKKNKNAQEVTQ